MIELKALILIALTLGVTATAFAQSSSQPSFLLNWVEVPSGFTLEHLFMNVADEAWMSEQALLASTEPCLTYDRVVLRYVGEPSGVPELLGQPLRALGQAIGEGVQVGEASEDGFLWLSADRQMVVDVDLFFGMVNAQELMVRYEFTLCSMSD